MRDVAPEHLSVLGEIPQLRSIDLENIQLSGTEIGLLNDLDDVSQSLELREVTDEDLRLVGQLKQLRTLDIHSTEGVTDAGDLFHTNTLFLLQGRAVGKMPDFTKGRILTSMNNLGGLCQARNLLGEAERLFRECHEKSLESLGDTDPITLSSLHNLAGVYSEQAQYESAAHHLSASFPELSAQR